MRPSYHIRAYMLFCLLSVALTGCARSPQVSFYTLSPMAQTGAVSQPPAYSVAVAPVTLPDLVDRPQLVLNTDGTRVHVLELHRWAEPLKSAIPRLLADNLSRLLGTDRVSSYPQSASNEADYRIIVDFLRFESTGDTVMIEVLWTVRNTAGSVVKVRRFKVSETIAGEGNESRVAAYSRALAALSSDIAVSLREERAVSR